VARQPSHFSVERRRSQNPANDAALVATTLKSLGFEVSLQTDADPRGG
jgi:uncharacterized caspase-like protein